MNISPATSGQRRLPQSSSVWSWTADWDQTTGPTGPDGSSRHRPVPSSTYRTKRDRRLRGCLGGGGVKARLAPPPTRRHTLASRLWSYTDHLNATKWRQGTLDPSHKTRVLLTPIPNPGGGAPPGPSKVPSPHSSGLMRGGAGPSGAPSPSHCSSGRRRQRPG